MKFSGGVCGVECRPLRHTTATAAIVPASDSVRRSSPVDSFAFRKEGKGNHRIKMETCERRDVRDSRDHRDRTTEGRGAERAVKRDGGGTERLRDGQAQACCRGDGGGSPFLRLYLDISTCKGSKEVSRSTAERRSRAGRRRRAPPTDADGGTVLRMDARARQAVTLQV